MRSKMSDVYEKAKAAVGGERQMSIIAAKKFRDGSIFQPAENVNPSGGFVVFKYEDPKWMKGVREGKRGVYDSMPVALCVNDVLDEKVMLAINLNVMLPIDKYRLMAAVYEAYAKMEKGTWVLPKDLRVRYSVIDRWYPLSKHYALAKYEYSMMRSVRKIPFENCFYLLTYNNNSTLTLPANKGLY